MPSMPVRIVTEGGRPVRIANHAIADHVRVITSYPSDPIRIVASYPSDPVRFVNLPPLLLDLEADTDVITSGGYVDRWGDQSGNGFDFTQTGAARPALQTIGGYPALVFDGVDDWMLGQNWAALDDLSSFAVFYVVYATQDLGPILNKMADNFSTAPGWRIMAGRNGPESDIEDNGGIHYFSFYQASGYWPIGWYVGTNIFDNHTPTELYWNGASIVTGSFSNLPISNMSSSDPVKIGINGDSTIYLGNSLRAIRFYSPTPNATQRTVIESELMARYGI